MRLTALIARFKCFWPPFFCIVPLFDEIMSFPPTPHTPHLNQQPLIWEAVIFFLHYSFQIRRLSQQQHLPTAQKKLQSPKGHKILFKFSLIMACNPWDPARLCGFPGGLLLQLQVLEIASALNQFGLWRPTRNPNFLLGLYFFQFNLPLT